ncbi:hypothetical protein PNA2_1418 [Pyrococcus sp. NA2]|uniref:hypothetical protein n=1 Tax=Pyrococcus sp. (strain NA2) TaxID=342949 RepID=UPI000209AF1B|nr:hypothetical protein [Pyrococcus sp. NA2]AEC52333.1 hypothetical protein PNA2_1418 [Pyrococcus sp. NA2]
MKIKYVIPIVIASGVFIFGNYLVRWISALLTTILLFAYSLEGWEPQLPPINIRRSRSDEVERLAKIIRMAERSRISRKIIAGYIGEIYSILGQDKGVKINIDSEKFLEELEDVLTFVEEDINERSKESSKGYRGS